MFKKVIYLGLMAGAIHFADAQKINLGKALDAGAKGVKALTFSNADAARLSNNNPVADKNSPYTKTKMDLL